MNELGSNFMFFKSVGYKIGVILFVGVDAFHKGRKVGIPLGI